MASFYSALKVFFLSVAISGTLAIVVRAIAVNLNFVSHPREDRWGKKPTPMLGGIAIVGAFVLSLLLSGVWFLQVYWILGAGLLVFAFGLVDDILHLSAPAKIVGQIISACVLIYGGVYVDIYFPLAGVPLSILWFVGMTNAFNLLDNMDGLSAGVAAISSGVLVFHYLGSDSLQFVLPAAALSGACVGFLFLNFYPAKMYMGDCGSQFLGISLAAFAVSATWKEATNLITITLVPVFVLSVPIFDVVLVSVLRKGSGRSVAQGGRDHSSHRLVALGVSEPVAVALFWALSSVLGVVSILAKPYPLILLTAGGVVAIFLILFGLLLGRVKVYSEEMEARERGVVIGYLFQHRREAFLIVLDVIAFVVSYAAAFALRLEGEAFRGVYLDAFARSLPIMISAKVASFLYFRMYQLSSEGFWRRRAFRLLEATFIGALVAVAVSVMAFRFENLPRVVFIWDWVFCIVLSGAIRLAVARIMRE